MRVATILRCHPYEVVIWRGIRDRILAAVLDRVLGFLNRLPIGERAVRYEGKRLYADSLDRYVAAIGWARGWMAHRERALLEATLWRGMVAVDVGANIGFQTLTMARCVGATGRVHSIEPDPRNFRLLRRAVTEAGYDHVRLHELAASNTSGRVTLHLAAANRGDHRLAPAAGARQQVTVEAAPLDDLLADEPRVDFIKIDVQGAEVAVLGGLAWTLCRTPRPKLLCELSPALLREAGADAEAFFGPLREIGFRAHRIRQDGAVLPVSPEEAWAAAESSPNGYDMIFLA
jgi:FkbM family methyltransferase